MCIRDRPRVQLQAEENGWDLRIELFRMLAHGCAHLAGWDHERSVEEAEAMLKCEKLMLEKAGFDKIYNLLSVIPGLAEGGLIGYKDGPKDPKRRTFFGQVFFMISSSLLIVSKVSYGGKKVPLW